ncbi:MAG: hypothetical protein J7L25_03000 [Deltaproteobacteria bacterium]|nr:hypothetical protein [Candidatus Tharpella aukensis]
MLIAKLKLTVILLVVTGLLFVNILDAKARADESTDSGEWQFGLELYSWAPKISVETATGDEVNIHYSDIIENLDLTLMSTVAARKGKWSFLVDAIYLDLKADDKGSLTVPIDSNLTVGTDLEVRLKSWIVTPLLAYKIFESPKASFDFAVGARYLWMKNDLKVQTNGPLGPREVKISADGDVWDGVVAVRGQLKLSEKWFTNCFFDIGTGDSDFTWQAKAAVGYKFKKFSAVCGYRHLRWEFDNDAALDSMYITGPYAGIQFFF